MSWELNQFEPFPGTSASRVQCSFTLTFSQRSECVGFQVFIETLLERADRAERRLLLLSSHTRGYTPVPGQGGRSLDGSTDDITRKMQGTTGNRVR